MNTVLISVFSMKSLTAVSRPGMWTSKKRNIHPALWGHQFFCCQGI
jgi:hypothetical protein